MSSLWTYPTQAPTPGSGKPGAHSSDPGDTVGYLWEEPSELANGSVRVRALLGCADNKNWSGATVHGSHNGTTYKRVWITRYRSTIGVLSGSLAAGSADWQPAATITVVLNLSPGTLISTDLAGVTAGVNLCLLGDEIICFQTATLTATNTYELTGIQRAWYDTDRVAHTDGERFVLLSPAQDVHELQQDMLGSTWYWKAASLNIASVEQSLADATENTLMLTGRGLLTEYQQGRGRQYIAGETLTQGDLVYLAEDAPTPTGWYAYKAVSGDSPKLGLVSSPGQVAAGEKVYVQANGLMESPTEATPTGADWAWTVGAYLYGSAVAGALSETDDGNAPIGLAIEADTAMIFAPRPVSGIAATYAPRPYHGWLTEEAPGIIDDTEYAQGANIELLPSGRLWLYEVRTSMAFAQRYSSDGGVTWTNPVSIPPGVDGAGGVASGITESGRIVTIFGEYGGVPYVLEGLHSIHSDDEGLTWSAPVAISKEGEDWGGGFCRIITVGGGKLLAVWWGYHGVSPFTWTAWAITSDDNGETWNASVALDSNVATLAAEGYNECSAAYLGGSKVVVLVRNGTNIAYQQFLSEDNGATWTDQGATSFDTATYGHPPWLVPYIGLNGRRMVACYYGDRTELKIRVILATAQDIIDSGVTAWQAATRTDIADILDFGMGYVYVCHPLGGPYAIGAHMNHVGAGFAKIYTFTWPVDETVPGAQAMTFANGGLHILDTDSDFDLILTPGSDLTADRILTLTTGDAARTVTLSGDPTLADWFDQNVKVAGTPTFAAVTIQRDTGAVFTITSLTDLTDANKDPRMHFRAGATPTTRWTVGVDLSDSNRLIFGGVTLATAIASLDTSGVFDVSGSYEVDGVKVVANQGAHVADATGAGDIVAQFNTLLTRLEAHGLLASA